MRSRRGAGFTVVEMFVALSIFSAILIVTTMLLRQSVTVWTSGNSREDASLNLQKARSLLIRDLVRADTGVSPTGQPRLEVTRVSTGLGGADAVWFLSAEASNGEFARGPDGYPFWQRNILYYVVVPQDHDELYDTVCGLSSNPAGDDRCPHKVMIRMVLDNPPTTSPLPAPPTPAPPGAEPEQLFAEAQIKDYLLAPDGLDVAALAALPHVEEVRIVATGLLWFKVTAAPGAAADGLQIDLRAVAAREARQEMAVGQVSLLDTPLTQQSIFSVLPNN